MSPKTGRPKKENAAVKVASFKADTALLERLQKYCDKSGRHKGEVIRTTLESYLEQYSDYINGN